MTSLSVSGLLGAQEPRLCSFPRGVRSAGPLAAEFSARTGLVLDPWQRFALDCIMQTRADGKWAARTAALIVPRQNGKGAVDEAWELAQLFLNGCNIVLHTAHHAKTAKSAFMKMRAHIEGSPTLKAKLKPDRSNGIRIANGEWGFTFASGQQLIYGTRTSGAGRGLTIDATVLDECQELTDDELDALKPTMVTARNPQTLYTGSAPKAKAGVDVLTRLMNRGRAGDESICYLEWSVDEMIRDPDLDDRALWAQANPGYGIRLFDDAILDERATMSDDGFGRERLGIVEVAGADPFVQAWKRAHDDRSQILGTPTYALSVAENREWACAGAAGAFQDGLLHVETGRYSRGTHWVVDFLADLASRRRIQVVVRPDSPAGSLIPELEQRKVAVVKAPLADYRAACGQLHDSVVDSATLKHPGHAALDIAVAGAVKRVSGDAWVWDLRTPTTDISPLEAVTLAAWGARSKQKTPGRFLSV